jgi:3-oxoacyl-[acyl-carrier protein] reductase
MRTLVLGSDEAVEFELAMHGLELVREGVDAEALVTLPPPVELTPVAQLEPDEWLRLFHDWVEEPFFASQPWLRAASERGSGAWVAVTSIVGLRPYPGGAAGACALALQTLARVAAHEGVRANVVAPGWREAPGIDPDAPTATPTDVAAAVVWLLSPEAAGISGAVVPVDGGYSIARAAR